MIPQKVEDRDLKDLTLCDMHNSLNEFLPILDGVFAHPNPDFDDMSYVSLLDPGLQLVMCYVLEELYYDGMHVGSNNLLLEMLNEWALRLFMKKYGLSREESIAHVKAQEEYNRYLINPELYSDSE
ncbi:uncharacterized protein LOC119662167 [Teleopsis dalmanni]|uniref:uncharacterized protein LOC119662167 n=1 Tax=Teleopsis dalmanni TaxID=139649 RepID=UPI0018CCF85E|nr:uncharacterized protein LOC119662167 [Teleopsis dalmanni]